jgi:nucleotidyltransferase/DNA polymerase involved in DNA repair
MSSGLIGHCDVDSFYVAAERVRDEYLRDVPVAVLGNQGACVIAKCYAMKAAGVKTGEPIWDAKKKCPDAVFIKRDFRWYETLSHSMLDVVRQVSPKVEYYSIDGATRSSEMAVRPGTTAQLSGCVTDLSVWVKRPPPDAKETASAPG